MAEPEKGVAYDYFMALEDFGTGQFLVDPTIAPGDFRIKKDTGGFANMELDPVVEPVGSVNIRIKLSANEMTADKIMVIGIDVLGQQWRDVSTFIDTEGTPGGISKILDIMEGDHIERADRVTINRKNTIIPVLDKDITGSLLKSNVTIRTLEP